MVDKIIAYEQGEMDQDETVEFFSQLMKTGVIRGLQGHYQRTACRLIEAGLLDRQGNVL